MSVYSVDHMPSITDDGYRGYNIDDEGQVVEHYDHTNESSIHGASGISGSRRLLAEPSHAPPPPVRAVPSRRRIRQSAGCCSSCVGCLITVGRLPIPSAICLILIWIGTGMFTGAGWAVLSETQSLFERYGPRNGNPATDPPPEWFLVGGGGTSTSDHEYVLRNPEDLGNRVPETFLSIQRAFCGIIPFMFLFSIIVIVDGSCSTSAIQTRESRYKSSSAGVCCSVFIILLSYLLLLAWVFFLGFATLGVYYYRIVMLRCDDLNNRGFQPGVQKNICIDLVQLGVIMFKSTLDSDFGMICGPGDSSRTTVGNLEEYCNNYHYAWSLMLVAFSGALITIIAMMHSLVIATGNYKGLQRKYMRPYRAETVATPSPAPTRRTDISSHRSAPILVVDASNGNGDYRRRSKDIELDYMDEDHHTSVSQQQPPRRRFEKDSHVGVDYYYKRY